MHLFGNVTTENKRKYLLHGQNTLFLPSGTTHRAVTPLVSLAQQMSRKAKESAKNIWSLGSNAFYMLHRTLLHFHKDEYFVSTLGFSAPIILTAAISDVMWWSAICPYSCSQDQLALSNGRATGSVMMSLDKQSVQLKSTTSFSNVTLQSKIWELEKTPWYWIRSDYRNWGKNVISSWGNCKPPNHPKLRNVHTVFYYDNLQMYFF